jgi:hypothetical protein
MGAVSVATRRAIRDLKFNCDDQFKVKIVGEFETKFTRFNASDMKAHVTAKGKCKY